MNDFQPYNLSHHLGRLYVILVCIFVLKYYYAVEHIGFQKFQETLTTKTETALIGWMSISDRRTYTFEYNKWSTRVQSIITLLSSTRVIVCVDKFNQIHRKWIRSLFYLNDVMSFASYLFNFNTFITLYYAMRLH